MPITSFHASIRASAFPDPLEPDRPEDRVVVTTERALGRIALAASEAGARFQREAIPHDPIAWMQSPRRIFYGGRAMEACLDRVACLRAVLLHGLGLDLDAEVEVVDGFMPLGGDHFDDGEDDDRDGLGSAGRHDRDEGLFARPDPGRRGSTARLRLYTATIMDSRDDVMMQAFHASMARSENEVRRRLVGRYGPDVADVAFVREGLNRASPLVIALVPAAVVDLIDQTALDWTSPSAVTFGVDIQQCVQL